MATTYLEMISKLQQQSLQALKQAQESQLAALSTAREIATQFAAAPLPTPEAVPSISALTELTSSFATQMLDQQKAYANQLAGFFDAARKDVTEQVARVASPTKA
jgi:hypothetical protein